MAHEHNTPAAGPLQILDGGGIGDVFDNEAVALIINPNLETIGVHLISDANDLGAVHLIAMFDSVNECFFESQTDAEDFAVGELLAFQELFDFFLDVAGFRRVAGNDQLFAKTLADLGHGLHLTGKSEHAPDQNDSKGSRAKSPFLALRGNGSAAGPPCARPSRILRLKIPLSVKVKETASEPTQPAGPILESLQGGLLFRLNVKKLVQLGDLEDFVYLRIDVA